MGKSAIPMGNGDPFRLPTFSRLLPQLLKGPPPFPVAAEEAVRVDYSHPRLVIGERIPGMRNSFQMGDPI